MQPYGRPRRNSCLLPPAWPLQPLGNKLTGERTYYFSLHYSFIQIYLKKKHTHKIKCIFFFVIYYHFYLKAGKDKLKEIVHPRIQSSKVQGCARLKPEAWNSIYLKHRWQDLSRCTLHLILAKRP